jgi:putative membrane-bound dehydrogenase-like protein
MGHTENTAMTLAALCLSLGTLAAAPVEMPQVLDDRLQLQLVAAEPDIVTPTGIAVDAKGRVLVIESNTHFPLPDYKRAPHDRILLLDDFGADGKAGKISVFFEGTNHTMNMAIHPDGSIYVATRAEIFRLTDKDSDGKSDQSLAERQKVAWLETKGDYPHNGLSGFAFDLAGNVYFGFGENLGADYKLIGTDGGTLSGGGEGGNIYCCDAKGAKLRRVATGFWNPFHVGFDAFGRLFAVDNDPDSRPPCRLLHIVEGGDYGYRYRNGRKGVHPFTAWNGELPGTLPMVAGTGEAPCAVVAYESDNLPEEYRGELLVTSWGDHRIERYHLAPRGASFSATMTPVVRGGENFRPVGMALAPDGSLFFSDWVDKSYNVHGKGRVWRLLATNPPKPSRPADTIEALSSPHGPWREAAARKLTREQAIKIASESKSERARSLAGRACVLTNQRWNKFQREDGSGWSVTMVTDIHRFAEVIARYCPEEFGKAAQCGEFYSRMLTERVSEEDKKRGIAFAEAWDAHRFLDPAQPVELRMASIVLFGPDPKQDEGGRFRGLTDDHFEQAALLRSQSSEFEMLFTNFGNQNELEKDWNASAELPVIRQLMAVAFRRYDKRYTQQFLPKLLASREEAVRLVAVMWIGESRLSDYRSELEKLLNDPKCSRRLFEATLAALEMLDGKKSRDPKDESGGDEYVLKLLNSAKASAEVRRFALRTLKPEHEQLTVELLTKLIRDADDGVRLEAIRTLRARPDSERWKELREIAADEEAPVQHRCEAILGLSPGNRADRALLLKLAESPVPPVSDEALRALRGFDLTAGEKERLAALAEKLDGPHRELARRAIDRNPPKDLPKAADLAAWQKLAAGDGDPQAGERIFYHARVGGCFRCHEYEGRGYTIGPDLSPTGKALPSERLLESIVNPSKEIAPMFTNWTILKTDGELLTGIHIGDEVDGRIKFADQNGRVFHVHPNDIDQRKPSDKSVMPDSLADNLTPQELRDLLAFLQAK